jgi:diaminopimelate epimerase
MKLHFYKYHGAGNDFVMVDGRKTKFSSANSKLVKDLCDRRFGIGADGVIVLTKPKNPKEHPFSMIYMNSDGSIGSMCGNGGRCIVRFAYDLGIIKKNQLISFDAVDGEHEAMLLPNGEVKLKMIDMKNVVQRHGRAFNYCGTTPHYMTLVENIEEYPLVHRARLFRDRVKDTGGVNMNIVKKGKDGFTVRTYERGVEDETLACGTGACSVATFLHTKGLIKNNEAKILMPGGTLNVTFTPTKDGFTDVWLTGPAEKAFEGHYTK